MGSVFVPAKRVTPHITLGLSADFADQLHGYIKKNLLKSLYDCTSSLNKTLNILNHALALLHTTSFLEITEKQSLTRNRLIVASNYLTRARHAKLANQVPEIANINYE
jgi:hypothetical protein